MFARALTVWTTRRWPAPWSDTGSVPAHEVQATAIGRARPMPNGTEVQLVSYGEQPHWQEGFRVEVWGLVERDDCLGAWRDLDLRGARFAFGPLDAQSWRDRVVDRAWERARETAT